MEHAIVLITENLELRPMDRADSERYRRLRNRPEIRKCFFRDAKISKEQQETWFSHYMTDDTACMFSIYVQNRMAFIGGIGIYNIDKQKKTAEVGRIIIDKTSAGGHGYGTEAILAVSENASELFAVQELCAYIYSHNQSSMKSFSRAGFEQTEENGDIIKMVYRGDF